MYCENGQDNSRGLTRANILVCFLMIMQLVLVLVLTDEGGRIRGLLPFVDSAMGLLTVNQLFSLFLPTLVFIPLICGKRRGVGEFLRIKPVTGRNIALIVLMSLFVQPLIGVLSLVAQLFFNNNVGMAAAEWTAEMSYLQLVATIALMPAIFEELALRGAVLGGYEALDERRAILINGLFFGLIHLDGQQLLYAIALGAFFSYVVLRTGSLLAGCIAHFTVNCTQVTMAYLLLKTLEQYAPADAAEYAEAEAATSAVMDALSANPAAVTAMAVSVIISIAISLAIVAGFSFGFFRLLKKFSLLNPPRLATARAGAENSIPAESAEPEAPENEPEPPELTRLKSVLAARQSFGMPFFVSFLAVIIIYMLFMWLTGCTAVQLVFLLGVLSAFFFALFFLRIRG